jgi:hypothetical protein
MKKTTTTPSNTTRSTGALITGGTALLALNMSTDAQAAIVTGTNFEVNGVPTSPATVVSYQHLEGFNGNARWVISLIPQLSALSRDAALIPAGDGAFKLLSGGYEINGSRSFLDQLGWNGLDGQQGYIGVQFTIDSNTHYGWMAATVSDNRLILSRWGYNDVANEPIKAGDTIPEPGTLAFLAAGAGCLMALRRIL